MQEAAHLRNIKESIEEIEGAIHFGIEKRQRTIGFHCSAAAADLLELYLHKKGLLPPAHILKHEWFASANKLNEKLPFDFEKKLEIFELVVGIEKRRNVLCYGTQQPESSIGETLEKFNKLRALFQELNSHEK